PRADDRPPFPPRRRSRRGWRAPRRAPPSTGRRRGEETRGRRSGPGRAWYSPSLAHRGGGGGGFLRRGTARAAAGRAGADLFGHRRRAGDRDVGLEGDEQLLADSLDLHQVLGAGEVAVLLAVVDDTVGDLLADA